MDLLNKYQPDKQIENYAFSLNACIGKGSSGTVYVGRHQQTQQVVAIKAVDMRSLKTEYAWKMLCSEVKIMKKLKHPHVVRLLDVFQTKNNTYIITEFCNQGDLRTYLKKKKSLTERESIVVISQIMSGLQELTINGIIHRDLKPANILIHDDVFKITDFGFAKKLDSMEDQLMDSLVGTPLYMAPQILNKQQYTSKSDVWSVGLILYELLYGRTPWPAVNVVDLVQKMCNIPLNFPKDPSVTQALTSFISKCLCFPEADRISIQDMCANSLFEEYVQKINNLLAQQKLLGGTTTNTNATGTSNLTDFTSIATQVQNAQKNNSTHNNINQMNDPRSPQKQQASINSAAPSSEARHNAHQGQQQSGSNLGLTPTQGMNLQINLNMPHQPPQSSSMSPVRMHSQLQPTSGRKKQSKIIKKNTNRNEQKVQQYDQKEYSGIKQINDMNEPYSPVSPIKVNFQKVNTTSSQQAKSMNALQEQISQENNSPSKYMQNSKGNLNQYNYSNQPKYPSSYHNLTTLPQQEKQIQTSDENNKNLIHQQPILNNYVRNEREVSPVKQGSYNDANFIKLLNNINDKSTSTGGTQNSGDQQAKIYNDNQKNIGYQSNHQKQNSQGVPQPQQQSFTQQQLLTLQQQNQQISPTLQRHQTNEGSMSPTISPPIPSYQPQFAQPGSSPRMPYQVKSEAKLESMNSQQMQQLNLGSPYQKHNDTNAGKFQERGFFLQQVQDQTSATNLDKDSRTNIQLQQQISQPYIQKNQQETQNSIQDDSQKQNYIKQYSLQYQYQYQKQNPQQEYNPQIINPQNMSPKNNGKIQNAVTIDKNSSSEQSPSSSFNQQTGNYSSVSQLQLNSNKLSQNNNSNSSKVYSNQEDSGRQDSPTSHKTQTLQQQNSFVQQQQQQRNTESPEGRYKTYSMTPQNMIFSNKSGGTQNNNNSSNRSITETNNSNSSPKNRETDIKNFFNSGNSQTQNGSTKISSNPTQGYSITEQGNSSIYKSGKSSLNNQSSSSRKDFESVIQPPNESSGSNLNHLSPHKRSMTYNPDPHGLKQDDSIQTPKNNGISSYSNYQNFDNTQLSEQKKNNNDPNQLNKSSQQRRRKSEYGTGIQIKNIFSNKVTDQQQNQAQMNSRSQQNFQIINNIQTEVSDDERRNPLQNFSSQNQNSRSRSLHNNHPKHGGSNYQNSPTIQKQISTPKSHSNQNIINSQDQQQIQIIKQVAPQNPENSPYKYQKYALKNYIQSSNNTSAQNTNNQYQVSSQNNGNNLQNVSQNSSSNNLNLKVYSTAQQDSNNMSNKGFIPHQQQGKIQSAQSVQQAHHGQSKSLTFNNFNSVMNMGNSQTDINITENSSNQSQNEFQAQDNIIESILCICKSVRFLKNQIDYNIKSILKLDEPFLYEKLIFLLNKHLVIQISMLKTTQMDQGVNVINLEGWTEYRASQNFNEIYKKIAQNYYDIISTHQNNWNRAHENQRFYDEAKKDYYFSKIFNQQLTQYNNNGSVQTNQVPQTTDEDKTNFYFYIYQLLKEIIKEVFKKLQQNLSKKLESDNTKLSREDSLVINCLSRLVDYHQLLKFIISQKEDFSLILKSININEFLKEKIITIEFYEALKQKMYIYDLITK